MYNETPFQDPDINRATSGSDKLILTFRRHYLPYSSPHLIGLTQTQAILAENARERRAQAADSLPKTAAATAAATTSSLERREHIG
jgi:hypothetical protein